MEAIIIISVLYRRKTHAKKKNKSETQTPMRLADHSDRSTSLRFIWGSECCANIEQLNDHLIGTYFDLIWCSIFHLFIILDRTMSECESELKPTCHSLFDAPVFTVVRVHSTHYFTLCNRMILFCFLLWCRRHRRRRHRCCWDCCSNSKCEIIHKPLT